MADHYRIRTAARADAPALGGIERIAFSDPWSERSLAEALGSPGTMALVAEGGEGVVGYLIARQVGGSGEILNLAVAPRARRRGVGRELLAVGLARLREAGVGEVFLEVRESNEEARRLYGGQGFGVVGLRKGYYRSPLEDALVLRLEFPDSA